MAILSPAAVTRTPLCSLGEARSHLGPPGTWLEGAVLHDQIQLSVGISPRRLVAHGVQGWASVVRGAPSAQVQSQIPHPPCFSPHPADFGGLWRVDKVGCSIVLMVNLVLFGSAILDLQHIRTMETLQDHESSLPSPSSA